MAQINFPVATSAGQQFEGDNGVIYTYVGTPPNGFWSGSFQATGLTTLDSRYLKLDSSNDPITAGLNITGGNVGIGTSSPDAELHVLGNYTAKIRLTSTSFGRTTFDPDEASIDLTTSGMSTTNKYTPSINFGSADTDFTTTNPKFGAAINAEASQAYTSNTTGGMKLNFWTSPSNPGTGHGLVQRMTIDQFGNVGIGTSSPDTLLHLSATSPRIALTDTDTGVNHWLNGDSGVGNLIFEIDRTSQASDPSCVFNISGSEKMRIKSNGNVGIGTSSPSSLLHLASNAPYITFEDIDNNQDWQLQATAWFALRNQTTSSELLRVTSTGNVGIGTSNPTELLHLNQDSAHGIFLERTGGAPSEVEFRNGSNLAIISNNASGVAFLTGSTPSEKVRIDEDGNVGIGTSSPDTLLHLSATSPRIALTDTDTGVNHWLNGDSGVGNLIFEIDRTSQASDPSCVFNISGSEKMRIKSNGNVGIGTTAPGSKLTVNGSFAASSVIVSGEQKLALNVNDGHGNSNLIFNDTSGVAQRNGSCARITATTDTTPANLKIQLGDNSVAGSSNVRTTILTLTTSGASITGSLSKSSGSFKIDHPLPALSETHDLVHSFVEAPDASNLYAGMVSLVDGTATVNIDTAHRMTEGTFEALNTLQSWSSSNESGYSPVKCSVSGNLLTIECQDATSTDTVYYEVRGVRKDPHMLAAEWTDSNGLVIVEPEKIIESEA